MTPDSKNVSEIQKKPLILVAEDIPKNLEIVCSILKKEDYRIAVASNGRQVLEMIPLIHPDLILMDVLMPEIDGFEVCEQLKLKTETKDIPIIFLTAKTDSEDIVKGFTMGAVDYVTKPFNGTELIARVKTHLELKFSRERLKNLIATKDKFFSIIAHDLRNPLQFLLLSADTLFNHYDQFDENKKKDYIRRFYRSSSQISALLENLLEWAMAQRGILRFRPEKLDISALIAENIEFFKDNAIKKNIELMSWIEPSTFALADKNMIRTVIRNLISNGVKFTRQGGMVKIHASRSANKENTIIIAVTDTGIGMTPEYMEGLFKMGEHHSTNGTDNEKGTGLGLLLCSEFIQRNNGSIELTSESGKGTCFTVMLPAYEL